MSWAFYAEGYQATLAAQRHGACAEPPGPMRLGIQDYPCIYDPSDNPFQYYRDSRDNPQTMKDLGELA